MEKGFRRKPEAPRWRPTLQTDYSVYTMRQASRRSWRIGQRQPVKVIYMAYRGTLQADALKLVAKKLQSSLAVEGELPEEGLAAYGDDGDDLMMALARQVVSGDAQEDAETLEAVFAQARDAEASAEEFLVDDGWQAAETIPEPDPVAVEVHVNGNGDGHHDVLGPTEELVLGNAHHANGLPSTGNGVNGNGHQSPEHNEEPPVGQQSLFSWAEFLADEPARPRGRSGKPKTASASLFQWALDKEQEQEKEPVGAGR